MYRFVLPIILIGISFTGFFLFTSPLYKEVSSLRAESASFDEALDNSKALEAERDKLTQKYNSIDPENLSKLEKLLPDNVDNIRLILEIERIASPYGMSLKEVKYDNLNKDKITQADQNGNSQTAQKNESKDVNKDYGIWTLEFSTQGTYEKFINFIKDLESNLRIVDIGSIQFSSTEVGTAPQGMNPRANEGYKYSFKIKTYWLKN